MDLAPSGNVGLKWGIINPGAPNLELSGFSNTRYTFKAIQRGQVDVVFSLNYRGKNASSRDYGRLVIQVTVK